MIEILNLYKSYGSHQVLTDLSICFENGQVYGIMGENGAGKTTLFRCIAGLEQYQGSIKSSLSPLKDHLGLLFTDPFFFSKITGKEYIRLFCNARQKKIGRLEEKNIFDLPLNQYINTYSSGMKKKLALMAVLLQGNQYFILDEPFNGIDIQSNILLVEIICELKEMGKIIIISSHIFSTLSETCDEINLLENGQILRKVYRKDYALLEEEMKKVIIKDKIKLLELE